MGAEPDFMKSFSGSMLDFVTSSKNPNIKIDHGESNDTLYWRKWIEGTYSSSTDTELEFVMSLDPNAAIGESNITLHWDEWMEGTEMLFNVTAARESSIRTIKTSSALLERCA